jgi:hypothetical protein
VLCDWPHTYYWHTYRPWYRRHVRKHHYRHPHWYRRYSIADDWNSRDSLVKKKALLHKWLKERRARRKKRLGSSGNSHIRLKEAREARLRVVPKPRRKSPPSPPPTRREVKGERRKRLKFRAAPRRSRPKPAFRKKSRRRSSNRGVRSQRTKTKTRVRQGRGRSMGFNRPMSRR